MRSNTALAVELEYRLPLLLCDIGKTSPFLDFNSLIWELTYLAGC